MSSKLLDVRNEGSETESPKYKPPLMHGRFFYLQLLVHPNPSAEDVLMRGVRPCLPPDLLDLIDTLQLSLIQEYFGFVSDIIDDILEETDSARAKLLALGDVMRKLGPATPMLANSTCDEIDRAEEMIEAYLETVFDA